MPPKGSTKAKPTAIPATGKASASGPKDPPSTPTKAKANAGAAAAETPAKAKATPTNATPRARGKKEKPVEKPLSKLKDDTHGAAPIDIMYEADTVRSETLTEVGGYGHDIRLRAPQPFDLVTSTILKEGDYAGHQAIIIKQSNPFNFMSLPKVVRLRIYNYYLSPPGKYLGKVEFISTQTSVTAKTYINGTGKNRLGLLRVCKEIADEARPILYSLTFRFDKTDGVTLWLATLTERCRALLVDMEIVHYIKSSGFPCMAMLATCPNIRRVYIIGGVGDVGITGDPKKAAAAFFKEAYRFLETMGSTRGDRYIGMDILSFGKKCFTQKEADGGIRAWDEDENQEFSDALKAKL